MAILKHIASKSSNYGAALEYLIFKHDELRKTPILDQNGNRIMRDEFYLDGLNCEPYSFDAACQQLNREYQKNKNKNEIKSHHYIISFDPRDSTENCLTGKRAQELGLEYAKANFPGHQALVCTHMDGHNGSGNIHVHIVINSLRKLDVPQQPFMERSIDCKAGYKHYVTNEYLKHLQKSLMDLCQREFLHTVAQNCTSNQINKNNLRLNQLSRTKEAYGRYRNVYLEDYSELKMEIAELDSLIDDLSIYMQSTGRKYADHAATLRSWSARKKRQQKPGAGIPDYTYNKEESL